MPSKYKQKFSIELNKNWAWHIGLSFCVEPIDIYGKRDVYFIIMLGMYDLEIGYLAQL